MSKYRCSTCGYVYDKTNSEFNELNNYMCPMCNSSKELFEYRDEFTLGEVNNVINSDITPYNAVVIDRDNSCIERVSGCINCGMCTKTCINREKMDGDEKCLICVGCGQCIMTCPKRVLEPKNEIWKLLNAKKEGKVCIASIAPASRVTLGDYFGYDSGSYLEDNLVGLLKSIGFDYVIDVSLGADFTIMEESYELLERIKNNKLPMITSCCPSWVEYCEVFYPTLINKLSSCKSPISMLSSLVKNILPDKLKIKKEDIYMVSITPCTSKKLEIKRSGLYDTDLIISINELVNYVKNKNIDFRNIKPMKMDKLLGDNSSSGLIFGTTGGVTEAVLRNIVLIKELKDNNNYDCLHKYNGVKEMVFNIGNRDINIAVIDEIGNAKEILDSVKKNKSKYDFIEIMNCRGGCIGGGGNSIHKIIDEENIKLKRIESIYEEDKKASIKSAYLNKDVMKIYDDYLDYPLSDKAYKLLHTSYSNKSYLNINKK